MDKIKKFFQFLKNESITDIMSDGLSILCNIVIIGIAIATIVFFIRELIKIEILKDVIHVTTSIIGTVSISVLTFILGLIKRYFDKNR